MFAWLELRTHCHATEDEAKVAHVLKFLCPSIEPTIARLHGYHGNPILLMTSRTDKARAIKEFWRLLGSHRIIDSIISSIDKNLDEHGVIHIRLDKQEACAGRLVLASHEDVVVARLKVARIPAEKGGYAKTAIDSIGELVKTNVSDS